MLLEPAAGSTVPPSIFLPLIGGPVLLSRLSHASEIIEAPALMGPIGPDWRADRTLPRASRELTHGECE
jgi:hypothetical protein